MNYFLGMIEKQNQKVRNLGEKFLKNQQKNFEK